MSPPAASLRLVPETSADAGPTSQPKTLPESELVRGLKSGDPAVCDRVYRLYAKEVWRMLHRILGDDPDLDDLHHEVFVQALRSASRFRGEAALKTWLIGIAVNCARTKLRSRRRRWWLRFMPSDELPELPASQLDDEVAPTARAVYELVSKLPDEERIAFTLRFVEGMTHGEVAGVMGCSVGTVKRRVQKGSSRFFAMAERHPELEELCAARKEKRS